MINEQFDDILFSYGILSNQNETLTNNEHQGELS